MPIISQGLTIPAGLANGSVADAGQITPLYNSLNAFNIPGTVGVFQQGFVDDVSYAIATGTSQDWAVTAVATKSIFAYFPFNWSTAAAAPTIQFRLNGANVTAAANMTMTNTANSTGLLILFIGGRTANTLRPLIGVGMDTGATGTFRGCSANVDLTTADTTSVGLTIGGAGVGFAFQHVRIWVEG